MGKKFILAIVAIQLGAAPARAEPIVDRSHIKSDVGWSPPPIGDRQKFVLLSIVDQHEFSCDRGFADYGQILDSSPPPQTLLSFLGQSRRLSAMMDHQASTYIVR